ncbi:MAG: amidohydrolase family protein [Alphaproteobacteria bacterium]|nr:amidohydrolase family protein [Alphaproteobacteria bacterium]
MRSSISTKDAIDCDIHPSVPNIEALLPYLNDHWRDTISQRGVHDLQTIAYPKNAPLTVRPDWRPRSGMPATDAAVVSIQALDAFQSSIAICNCLYGVQLLMSEDMAAAFASAVNDWMVAEFLNKDPRLRASVVIPTQNPEMAVAEIERVASDPRFVSILMLVMDEKPLGRRSYWPIYAAAERHNMPICVHAGSAYKHPVTSVGWPSYYVEDYASQSPAFHNMVSSFICEGVFSEYPGLKVVLAESGVTWLPAHLWRLTKFWRGLRAEIPWVDRTPTEIARDHIRLTLQPLDAPPTAEQLERIMDHMGSDEMVLFSTDYPHWQFDGVDVIPEGISPNLARKIMVDNPKNTYPRLQ